MSGRWSILLCCVLGLTYAPQAFAYDEQTTHPGLTEQILEFYNSYYHQSLTTDERELIIQGSIDEDYPVTRSLNHFYDPVRNIGLEGARTSKQWATDGSIIENNWSWPKAIDAYAKGDRQTALIGLGHTLHLIEDASVPDHTRNDQHAGLRDDGPGSVSPYEIWTKKTQNRQTLQGRAQTYLAEGLLPVSRNNLGDYFDFLANYSNNNFFSQDTITDEIYQYAQPRISEIIGSYAYGIDNLNNDKFKLYKIVDADNGQLIKVLEYNGDTSILEGYFNRLGKQAVLTGVGVTDLFFKEAEQARKAYLQSENQKLEEQAKKAQALQEGNFFARLTYAFSDAVSGVTMPFVNFGNGMTQGTTSGYQKIVNATNALRYGEQFALKSAVVGAANVVEVVSDLGDQAVNAGVTYAQKVSDVVNDVADTAIAMTIESIPVSIAPLVPVVSATPATIPTSATPTAPVVPAGPSYITIPSWSEYVASTGGSGTSGGGSSGPAPVTQSTETIPPEAVKPAPTSTPDTTPPDAVADLTATAVSPTSISFAYTTPTDATTCIAKYATATITADSWATATVATSPITGLNSNSTYFTAVKCSDSAGNESVLSNIASVTTPIPPPEPATHVVISEMYIDMPMPGTDNKEFVELYNPTNADIDIAGYSLQYLSATATSTDLATKKNFTTGAVIKSKSFYLLGLGGYTGTPTPDMTWSQSLGNIGATVFLVSDHSFISGIDDENIIDQVAYGSATILPAEGSSIERKTVVGAECVVSDGTSEFLGNTCDTNSNSADFTTRATPTPQSSQNLPEPRSAPYAVSNTPAVASYASNDPSPQFTPQLRFSWTPVSDAIGVTSTIKYKLIETTVSSTPVTLVDTVGTTSFAKNISEVGKNYSFTIQATDRDGLASEITNTGVSVPGYFTNVKFYTTPSSTPLTYSLELAFDQYPFIPISIPHPFLGALPGFHAVIFYYDRSPDTSITSVNDTSSGHLWGSVNMPGALRLDYPACGGYPRQSFITPDTAKQCDWLTGGVKGMTADWDSLFKGAFKKFTVSVKTSQNPGVNPQAGVDYVTMAFYGYVPNSNNALQLIAVDPTKRYFTVAGN